MGLLLPDGYFVASYPAAYFMSGTQQVNTASATSVWQVADDTITRVRTVTWTASTIPQMYVSSGAVTLDGSLLAMFHSETNTPTAPAGSESIRVFLHLVDVASGATLVARDVTTDVGYSTSSGTVLGSPTPFFSGDGTHLYAVGQQGDSSRGFVGWDVTDPTNPVLVLTGTRGSSPVGPDYAGGGYFDIDRCPVASRTPSQLLPLGPDDFALESVSYGSGAVVYGFDLNTGETWVGYWDGHSPTIGRANLGFLNVSYVGPTRRHVYATEIVGDYVALPATRAGLTSGPVLTDPTLRRMLYPALAVDVTAATPAFATTILTPTGATAGPTLTAHGGAWDPTYGRGQVNSRFASWSSPPSLAPPLWQRQRIGVLDSPEQYASGLASPYSSPWQGGIP